MKNDDFSIKNFILVEPSEFPGSQSLKDPFLFNGFIFGVCLKGTVSFQLNYKVYEVEQNEIFTILPNQICKVIADSEDLMLEVLFLSSDFILQLPLPKNFDLLAKIADFPQQKINEEALQHILEIHTLIAKHYKNERNPFREKMASGFIYALLMEIAYLYEGHPGEDINTPSRQELLTKKFFGVLINHYREERSVAFYADKLCLTPKYLSMVVKKITGYSPLDWINEAVVIEAKRLLKTTDNTVLQISEELKFSNPSFFGRFFKQYAGCTPLEYRKT